LTVRLSLSLFLAAVLASAAARPALAGPVAGRVVDPDGRAVAGATVHLAGGGSTPRTATTNARGEFTMAGPDAGRLELRVAAAGFRAEPIAFDGAADPRDLGTVTLAVSAIAESIVVSAAQVEIPLSQAASSVTVLSGADLAQRQIHTVADALRGVPGLAVVRYGGTGALTNVFPRGGESDYSLVLVDGVPVNTFGGDFDFAHVPTVNVDRVEIVRGPQSAVFGSNAIGSVVRVVTRRGGPLQGTAAIEGGSLSTFRTAAAASGSRGDWEWSGSAERLATDGRQGQLTEAGETIVNDDYTRTYGALSGGWHDGGGAVVRGDVRYSRDERGFPGPFGTNPIGAFSGIDDAARGVNDRLLAGVTGIAPVTPRVRVHGSVTHARLDSDFESAFGPSTLTSRRLAVRGQADVVVAEAFDVSAGIDLHRERAGSTFITAGAEEIPIERLVAGYFGEARWRSGQRLFVTAGVRVDDIRRDEVAADPSPFAPRPLLPADSVVSTNPKLSVAWFARTPASSFTKLRLAAGTGIRPPNGFEIAFTDNPSLKPERSQSFEAGVDQAFAGGRGLLEATAFHNTYDDLIVAVGSFEQSSRYRTDNISNARSRGLELAATARGRMTAGGPIDLQVRVGYTWLSTEILAVDQSSSAPPPFEVGQPLLRRPRHQFSTELLVDAGRLGAFVQGGGRSRTLDVEPTLGSFHPAFFDAPGYHVWSAGAAWRLAGPLEIFGRVDNLFDRTYEEALGYPALGRTAFGGVRIASSR
jgi:outer membrane cobalamin receptor